jgi:hypothetical protein
MLVLTLFISVYSAPYMPVKIEDEDRKKVYVPKDGNI